VVTGDQIRWGYVVIWEFVVRPGREARFERVYGPSGDWVRLFQQDPNHLRTELIRVPGTSRRYLTLDFWKSQSAYEDSGRSISPNIEPSIGSAGR
jgi:hypothetical protein